MTYVYVAVEVVAINAVIFTGVFFVARKAVKQFGQMMRIPNG